MASAQDWPLLPGDVGDLATTDLAPILGVSMKTFPAELSWVEQLVGSLVPVSTAWRGSSLALGAAVFEGASLPTSVVGGAMPMPIASMALAQATAPFVDDGADNMPTVGVDGFTTMVPTLEVGLLDAPLEVSNRTALAVDALVDAMRELDFALARRVTGILELACTSPTGCTKTMGEVGPRVCCSRMKDGS